MADVNNISTLATDSRLNVTDRLATFARSIPDSLAVISTRQRGAKKCRLQQGSSRAIYDTITFADLDADVTRIANGLVAWGVPKGARLALLVKPGIDFVALVFALLRAGTVIVLVDPGLGRKNLIRCLAEARPEGFVAISAAQAVRATLRKQFPQACWNVTVGYRWFWGGKTIDDLRVMGSVSKGPAPVTYAADAAAIIFTSGSTGVPKGVLYTHQMFDTQVSEIQAMYDIETGGVDLGCFPLFALFNAAMGVTTVLPDMDFSRPAAADPEKLLAAANDWKVNQAFASPAIWRLLSDHCTRSGARIDSLRQVFSCGAPVPPKVLQSTLGFVGAYAKMHTPYGSTECLPVSTISALEILNETADRTAQGAGVCVGRKFDSIEWRVIRITDEPIATIEDAQELPLNEIGELIVLGPQVSPKYATRTLTNSAAKISNLQNQCWHRTGDVGYFDEQHRFWYCGRKSQRVETPSGPLFTDCIEPLFGSVPGVSRVALVGIGPQGREAPVIVFEPDEFHRRDQKATEQILHNMYTAGAKTPQTEQIKFFLPCEKFPTDIRHNAKINREQLAHWATKIIEH